MPYLGFGVQAVVPGERERSAAREFELPGRIPERQAVHDHPSPGPDTPEVAVPERRKTAAHPQFGLQLSGKGDPFLQREGLRQGRQVHRGLRMERDERIVQQVLHLGIGQNIGVRTLEAENLQIAERRLAAHGIDLSHETGIQRIHPVGHSGIARRSVLYLGVERGERKRLPSIGALHRTADAHLAVGGDLPAFQHALRNHVQHGLQRGSVQPVAQVEKQRPGRRRVAPHGSRQVQLRTVDTEQGVVQRERALRPVQFDGGAQTGGHAIDQQFAVLPEKDVPVPEIERQHGVSLPEPGPQPQPGIPDIGEDLRFAVVERHRTMTQRDVPDGDFTDGPHGIRRCIRRRAGRKRVGGGEDVPVRTPRPVPEGIDVGTVQREFQYVDFPVSQVADRIEDQHGLAERKQRVGPLPERIAECRRNQRAVRQFHAEPRKGGEKGQLHAAHPQPGVQTPVGDPLHDGRQLRGRENEIQHDSRADEQQQQHASRRNGAYPDDSLRATVHWQILLFFSKDNDFSETSHRTPGHIPGRPPLGTVRNRHAA